jgi:hypothetical protein
MQKESSLPSDAPTLRRARLDRHVHPLDWTAANA